MTHYPEVQTTSIGRNPLETSEQKIAHHMRLLQQRPLPQWFGDETKWCPSYNGRGLTHAAGAN